MRGGAVPIDTTEGTAREKLPPAEYEIDDKHGISKEMLDSFTPEDRAIALNVINRYKANPNSGTQEAMERQLARIVGKQPATAQGTEPAPMSTAGKTPIQIKAEEARLKTKEQEEVKSAQKMKDIVEEGQTPGTEAYARIEKSDAEKQKHKDAKAKLLQTVRNFSGAIGDVMNYKDINLGVGSFDYDTSPMWALTEGKNTDRKSTAQAYVARLKDFAQTIGLKEIRDSGVAPGSITEKEWPKFEAALAAIKPEMSEAEFMKNIKALKATYDAIVADMESQGFNVKQGPAGDQPAAAAAAETKSVGGKNWKKGKDGKWHPI